MCQRVCVCEFDMHPTSPTSCYRLCSMCESLLRTVNCIAEVQTEWGGWDTDGRVHTRANAATNSRDTCSWLPPGSRRGRRRRPAIAACTAHARARALSLWLPEVRACPEERDAQTMLVHVLPLDSAIPCVQVVVGAEGESRRRGGLPRLRGTGAITDTPVLGLTLRCRCLSGTTPHMQSKPARGGSGHPLPSAVTRTVLTLT